MPLAKILNGLRFTFRALRYRNYRLFFMGQSVSLIGMWIQNVAMGWLVYRLTNSALLLGIVGFAENIPMFLLTPFAGVLVDRWDRRRTLIVTQTLAMCQALIMAVLVLSGFIAVWHIILMSVFLGTVMAVDATARQSFWVKIIDDKENLGNAIALNSTMYNSARLIGPAVAGLVIAAVGEGICFFLNGISYIAVIAAMLAMRLAPKAQESRKTNFIQGLKEGFDYTYGNLPIRITLILLSMMSLVAIPYLVLMPVVAKEIFEGGPRILGYLVGCSGLGALVGAVYFASRKNAGNLARYIPLSAGFSGLSLIMFSLSETLWLSLILIILVSFGMMIFIASCNTYVQTIVEDEIRGRVMSFYTMAFIGMTPFGNLLIGGISGNIGTSYTFLIIGIIVVLGALVYGYKTYSGELLLRHI